MLKKQNGITLVALVITIIVLLILAGVTLSMVVGDNGILTRAKQSQFETEQAKVKEEVEMALADLSASFQVKRATDSSSTYTTGAVYTELSKTLKNIKTSDSNLEGYYITAKNGDNQNVVKSETNQGGQPAFDADGNATLTFKYNSEKLKKSAKKGWTGPLTYTVTFENWEVKKDGVTGADDHGIVVGTDNNGGY